MKISYYQLNMILWSLTIESRRIKDRELKEDYLKLIDKLKHEKSKLQVFRYDM